MPRPESDRARVPRLLLPFLIAGIGFFALAPYVVAFRYIHPSFDDMWYFFEADTRGVFRACAYWYLEVSGRFGSNSILSLLGPLTRSEAAYRALCAANFVALILSLQRFFRLVVARSVAVSWQITALALATWLTVMSPSEGFFWLAGSVTYVLGTAVVLYAVGGMLDSSAKAERAGRLWFWLILAIGMNELNMLIVWAAFSFIVLRDFALRKSIVATVLRFGLPILAGSLALLLSPGTWHRVHSSRQELPASGHLLGAIQISVHEFPRDIYTLLMFSPVLVLVAILLLSDRSPAGVTTDRRRAVLLATAGAVLTAGLIFSMILFYAFTQGGRTIGRVLNVVYLLSIVAFVLASVQFGLRKIQEIPARAAVLAAVLLACFSTYLVRPGSSIRLAYGEYREGQWSRYNTETNARRANADLHHGENLAVPGIASRPWSLFVWDLSPDSTQRYNRYYARFYRVRTMHATPSPSPQQTVAP